jgi:predicted amidohydrolase
VARIVELIAKAAESNVELVVFPEPALTEYFGGVYRSDISSCLEPALPSKQTQPIFDVIARSDSTSVVLPFAESGDGAVYNSAVLIDASAQIVGRYRKMHIPGEPDRRPGETEGSFEKSYFQPGDLGFPVHATGFGAVGMAICYDRRFPETYRWRSAVPTSLPSPTTRRTA